MANPIADIVNKIPKNTISGALMLFGVPEVFAVAVERLALDILSSPDPLYYAERAAAVVASKAASDALIDEALKSTNVMEDETGKP